MRGVAQAHAEPDPSRAGKDEVDAEEDAERVERGVRPVRRGLITPKNEGDQAGDDHPDPQGEPCLHVEAEEDAHEAGGDEGRAQDQREPDGGEQRTLEGDETRRRYRGRRAAARR